MVQFIRSNPNFLARPRSHRSGSFFVVWIMWTVSAAISNKNSKLAASLGIQAGRLEAPWDNLGSDGKRHRIEYNVRCWDNGLLAHF